MIVGGFVGRQGSWAGSVGYEEEVAPTQRSNITTDVLCFHGSQDPLDSNANAIGRNGGLENCICYDARGNGDGETANTIIGDHNNRVTDYTSIVQNVGVDLYNGSLSGDVAVNVTTESCSVAGHSGPSVIQNVSPALDSSMYVKNQAQDAAKYAAVMSAEKFWNGEDVASTITQRVDQNRMPDKDQFHGIVNQQTVRRLLPIESERLMGFPDNHTRIAWNGKPEEDCPDAPRYKACGNSFCVNVMEWIGRRIEQFK